MALIDSVDRIFEILNCINFLFFCLQFVVHADIDECTSSPNVCIQNAYCSNTVGSYVCQCDVGYSGHGNSNCTGEYTGIQYI